jgi:6-phosphogluconate dehydrogenase
VPCAAYFGAGGAGHYVKTVHNGIEYADMQMIAEVYGLMRDGQGRTADGYRRPSSRAGTAARSKAT